MASSSLHVGRWGVSEELREFVAEMPFERSSIVAFVRDAADSLAPESRVLDLGAGDAPYRGLFEHCDYVTADWGESLHERAAAVDVIAAADALPLDDASFDAVLCTQVLEHVPEPAAVVREIVRVLRPSGRTFLTIPFVWELHELPHDFWRFTPASLELLLTEAGLVEISIEPRNDCFTTIAQLLQNLKWRMGRAPDGRDGERESAALLLDELSEQIAALAALDAERVLPLGWTATARRP